MVPSEARPPVASLEEDAIVADARSRLSELRAVARDLWPHRDDPEVLSELTCVLGQIRSAERQLGDEGAPRS